MATDFTSAFRDALLDFLAPLAEAGEDPATLNAWLAQLGHTATISGSPEVQTIFVDATALQTTLANLNPASLESLSGLISLLQAARQISGLQQALTQFANDPANAAVAGKLGEDIMSLLLASYLRRNHMPIFRAASILTLIQPAETAAPSAAVVQNGVTVRYPSFSDSFNFEAVGDLVSHPGPTLQGFYFPNNMAQGTDAWLAASRLFDNLGYLANAVGLAWQSSYQPSVPAVPGPDPNTDPGINLGADPGEPEPEIDDADGDGVPDSTDDGSDTGTDTGTDDNTGDTEDDDDDAPVPVPDPLPDSYFTSFFPGFRLVLLAADPSSTDAGSEVALEIQCSSSSHPGATPGYIVSLVGTLDSVTTFDSWRLTLTANGQVPGFVLQPSGFHLVPSAVPLAGGAAKVLLERLPPTGSTGPVFLFGSAGGTRLEIGATSLEADFSYDPSHIAAGVAAKATKCSFVIHPGDGDSFLSSVLPANGLNAGFDLGLGYSSDGGLSFQGAAGLDATLPIGFSLGGVITIPSIHLGLTAGNAGLQGEVSATVGVAIGPVQGLVDRMGVNVGLTFPSGGGNFGPMDFSFAFKPPSGVGLAINSAGVSGGGFLSFLPAQHEYSGVLQLQFNDLALQAFGLITTQVAGGDGYSLLALVDANFPPVQLGWGFTLNGVGGLLAVHRSASVDALGAAVKAGKLAFMFPKNAITSASQILGQLDTLFPTAPGRFLFGPMALIGWGTPTVLTASVAVILELPEPITIILIARLEAKFPSPSAPLVHLNMDALGVLDLTQGELSLDATLFDSKLITFAIAGDMALRANWSTQREFLLAVGGFHPQFSPPAGFPSLKRVTIDMPSGIVSKLRLSAYLAVTSNSLQFGAALDVFIGVSGFGLSGHLGFDALLQLDPFHFEADISGSIALTAGGDDLTSVSLDATLTGPAPWNIAGKFKFHVIFFTVHISFSQTWGQNAPALPPTTVDVGALIAASLADPRSWDSLLPTGLSALVTTRQVDDPNAIFAHPLGRLEVHQRVAPLGLTIERFGSATLSGANEFTITSFNVGSASLGHTTIQDDFAPAQFFNLSDTDKLARPSFERHDAGALMSGYLVSNGTAIPKTTDYETSYIDIPGGAIRRDEGVPQPFPWGFIGVVMLSGSAAVKTISTAGNRRYAAPGNPITVAEPAFVLADTTSLAPQANPTPTKTTYSDMRATLKTTIASNPAKANTLQIIATHEVAA